MFRNQPMHTDTEETVPFWLGGKTAEQYNMTTMDEHKDFLLPPPSRHPPPHILHTINTYKDQVLLWSIASIIIINLVSDQDTA